MARAYDTDVLVDLAGNVWQGAVGTIYTDGAASVLATDAFAAASGGSPVTTVTTDSSGRYSVYFTTPKSYWLKWTDNGHTAHPVNNAAAGLQFTTFVSQEHQAFDKAADEAANDANTVLLSTVTAKGDLIVGSAASAVSNLVAGTDTYLLTADAASALGIKWAAPPTTGGSISGLLTATATSAVHTITNTWSGNNALEVRNTLAAGYSVIAFKDDTGALAGLGGYSNSGVADTGLRSAMQIASYSSTATPKALFLSQYISGSRFNRLEFRTDLGFSLYRSDGTTKVVDYDDTAKLVSLLSSSTGKDVAVVKNSSASGYSTIEFQDSAAAIAGVIGHANSSAGFAAGAVFLGSQAASTTVPKELRLVQFMNSGGTNRTRVALATSGDIELYDFDGTTKALVISGSLQHTLSNKRTGQNVSGIQSTHAAGYSALQFLDNSGTAFGSFGYANTSATFAPGVMFLGSQAASATVPTEIRLVQFLSAGGVNRTRQQFATDGSIKCYLLDGTTEIIKAGGVLDNATYPQQQLGFTDTGPQAAVAITGGLAAHIVGAEHVLSNSWTGQNTVAVINMSTANDTYSAIRFLTKDRYERAAVGYGNTATAVDLPFAAAVYFESSSQVGSSTSNGSTANAIIPIRLVTTGTPTGAPATGGVGFGYFCRINFAADLTTNFLGHTNANRQAFSSQSPFMHIDHFRKAMTIPAPASQTIPDGEIETSGVEVFLDEAGNNLKFRVKYAGGTLKTGTVALV